MSILSSYLNHKHLFPSDIYTNCTLFTTLLRATRPALLVLLDFVALIIFPEAYMTYEVLHYVIFFVFLLLPFS